MLDSDFSPAFPQRISPEDAYRLARGAWRPEAVRSTRLELDATGDAPRLARRAVDLHLGAVLPDDVAADVRLLVSELVANAWRHGDATTGIVVHLAASRDCVRAEVCDRGAGFDPPASAGGWGLRLLDTVADRWGIAGDDGTCVWFELDVPLR
jgi:anti-sigma regulatory factor (Ser/Thr protein kinase)